MRRPTPLPPTGGRRDDVPAPAVPIIPTGQGPDADASSDLTETAPIAPLIPMPEPGAAVPGTPEAGAQAAPVDAGESDERRLGLRDLWRARRARRRALRAEVRRFTARQRRRRTAWLVGVLGALLLVAGTVGVAYSPLFALQRIEVVGTAQLSADEVAAALSGQIGTPLAAIDESEIKAALVGFPLVESYTLEAVPPHDLVVRIVERTPIGAVATPAGYALVDAAGVVLATTPEPPAGYPVVEASGGLSSDAFTAAGQVMRALPADLRAQVTAVTASSPDDVRLTLAGAEVVWGSGDDSATKALVLQRIMAGRPGASAYDVSSPSAVVVR
ncbi:cell division protein FtsQ/DivIB [Microbacterium sp. GXF7504]